MRSELWIILPVFGVALGAAAVAYFTGRAQMLARRSNDPSWQMRKLARAAMKLAESRGKRLDYTPPSIKNVEAILGQLHKAWQIGRLSDSQIQAAAMHFGAYVGEVMCRRFGGKWKRDHPTAGAGTYPVHLAGGDSFPVAWCAKRILNGTEDNVWAKFQSVTRKLETAD